MTETTKRDVMDVVTDIAFGGIQEATTAEIREIIEWLHCELDNRKAAPTSAEPRPNE